MLFLTYVNLRSRNVKLNITKTNTRKFSISLVKTIGNNCNLKHSKNTLKSICGTLTVQLQTISLLLTDLDRGFSKKLFVKIQINYFIDL